MTPLVLLVMLLAQPQQIDPTRPPWSQVTEILATRGPAAAADYLTDVARAAGTPRERAHAWVWAGRLGMVAERFPDAGRDFREAMRADPRGIDGRWGAIGAVDVALATGHWWEAERLLGPVLRDPDPMIRTYARARAEDLHSHFRVPAFRTASVLAALAAWALTAWAAWRRRRGLGARFGAALLVTESLALGGALALPALVSDLAQPGWMAGAVPSAVLAALAWSARDPAASRGRRLLAAAGVLVACAAMVYLALDLTWWSAHAA